MSALSTEVSTPSQRRSETRGAPPIVAPGLMITILLLFVVQAWRIAQDPALWGADSPVYERSYFETEQCGCLVTENRHSLELLWPILQMAGARIGMSFPVFFGCVVFAQLVLWLLVAMRLQRILDLTGASRLAFVLAAPAFILLWPFITSALVNVLRSGIAIPLVLLALMLATERRWLFGGVLAFSAVGIQQPVALALLAGGLLTMHISRRWALVAFALGSVIYAADLGGRFFALIGLGYVSGEIEINRIEAVGVYDVGVRLDFLLSAIALVLVLLLLERWWKLTPLPGNLVELSIGLTMPFLLLGTIAFSDRLLQGAWIFIPLLILAMICTQRKYAPPIIFMSLLVLALWCVLSLIT